MTTLKSLWYVTVHFKLLHFSNHAIALDIHPIMLWFNLLLHCVLL